MATDYKAYQNLSLNLGPIWNYLRFELYSEEEICKRNMHNMGKTQYTNYCLLPAKRKMEQ